MKAIKKTLFKAAAPALLCLASWSPVASAQAQMTPEQVAKLYLDFAVHDDVASVRKLNDYLKPINDGKDAFDIETVKKIPSQREAQFKGLGSQLAGSIPDVKQPQKLSDTFAKGFSNNWAALQKSDCKVLSSEIGPNTAQQPDGKIATITYECVIPNIQYSFEKAVQQVKTPNEATLQTLADEFVRATTNPKGVKKVTGKQPLYSAAKGIWSTGSYADWVDPILAGFEP